MTTARSSAAVFGFAWLCYAICEALWVVAFNLVSGLGSAEASRSDAFVGVALLPLYPLLGAAFGALLGRALQGFSNGAAGVLASLSVVVALYVNLATEVVLGVSGFAPLVVLVAIGATALRAEFRAAPDTTSPVPLAARLGHPFVLVPLAVSLVWVTRGWLVMEGVGARAAACAVALAAATALAASTRGWKRLKGAPPWRATAATAVVAAALLTATSLRQAPPALPVAPVGNGAPVVMIVLDTLRADHLGLYGYERDTDPKLRAFAAGASVYEAALMPSDMTLTSHASMFTGRLVSHHGAVPTSPVLDEGLTTLAEMLRAGGYGTYGVVSNCGWMDAGNGLGQGFDYWDTRCGRSPFAHVAPMFLRDRIVEAVRRNFAPERGSYAWRPAAEITDEALALVERVPSPTTPFFLFVNYMDVHRPIHPPGEYQNLYPGREPTFDMERDWTALHKGWRDGRHATPAERAHLVSQYDGALRYVDQELGRLLDGLGEAGLLSEALVIITSDHGESFGSHGVFGHGASAYQDNVHVPLVLKLPGQARGRRVGTPVSGVDILPTVADVLGLPVPEAVDGRSLLAAADPARVLIVESSEGDGEWMRGLVRGTTKLIEREQQLELYDLSSDANELANLIPAELLLAEELLDRLTESLGGERMIPAGEALPEKEAARLRALGYLE